MKRFVAILTLAGLMCAALCACAEKEKPAFAPEGTVEALLEAPGVFSEELERLDDAILEGFYGITEDDGVVLEVGYCSTGATAEEVAVLFFEGVKEAQAFEEKALAHIDYQKEANESYRPQEMPKLEEAIVERRGESILILVCDDPEAARAVLG